MLADLLELFKGQSEAQGLTIREVDLWLSKQKHSNLGPANLAGDSSDPTNIITASIYAKYEQTLKRMNSLDFDDILVEALKLFTQHPETVEWCNHILVDELYAFLFLELNIICNLTMYLSAVRTPAPSSGC